MGPRVVLVLGLLTVAVEVAGQEVLYYHHDATGNRVAMTDETGQVVWQADVRPFGEGIPSPSSRLLRFLGQEREAGTTAEGGLYMLGARYLDPFLGRFISPDPLPLDKVQRESSQRFNLYSYALNNPYRFHDATGFEPEPTEGITIKREESVKAPKPAEGITINKEESLNEPQGITINREGSLKVEGEWVKFEKGPPTRKPRPMPPGYNGPLQTATRWAGRVWAKIALAAGGGTAFDVVNTNSATSGRPGIIFIGHDPPIHEQAREEAKQRDSKP